MVLAWPLAAAAAFMAGLFLGGPREVRSAAVVAPPVEGPRANLQPSAPSSFWSVRRLQSKGASPLDPDMQIRWKSPVRKPDMNL